MVFFDGGVGELDGSLDDGLFSVRVDGVEDVAVGGLVALEAEGDHFFELFRGDDGFVGAVFGDWDLVELLACGGRDDGDVLGVGWCGCLGWLVVVWLDVGCGGLLCFFLVGGDDLRLLFIGCGVEGFIGDELSAWEEGSLDGDSAFGCS